MLKSNATIRSILKKCVQAQYKISPVPKQISESLPIYTHFANLGNMIQYRQDQCPVTKMRLETIKMTFHDPARTEEQDKRFENGHIIRHGSILSEDQEQSLTELERQLVDTRVVGNGETDYKLELEFLTRNEDSVRFARDRAFADRMAVEKTGDVKERLSQAEIKAKAKLSNFLGIFD
ncbi:hypothetical protein TRVA0_051S00606 [Trichomonascus vanleenenianus]|uniref:uncharacterized protein n=1 Tax=Trichomonascus vanleenenianus TaxID=2268995 RepID=UPI003ECB11F0